MLHQILRIRAFRGQNADDVINPKSPMLKIPTIGLRSGTLRTPSPTQMSCFSSTVSPRRNRVWCGLAALLACLLVGTAPAFAARGHILTKTFGGPCTGAGGACEAGQLKEPSGVAVSEASGEIYVVDRAQGRVEEFSAQGSYMGEFAGPSASGTGTVKAGSVIVESVTTETGLFSVGEEIAGAGIPSGTTITAVGSGTLEVSQAALASLAGAVTLEAHQSFAEPAGIAVDNSCAQHKPTRLTEGECEEFDSSNGDVYVDDYGHGVIDKFSPTGVYIGQISRTPTGAFELGIDGVAVDPAGTVWVAEEHYIEGVRSARLDAFGSASGNPFVKAVSVDRPGVGFLAPPFAVDGEDNFYFGGGALGESRIAEASSNGTFLKGPPDESAPTGVAVEIATGDVYVDNATAVERFGPEGAPLETLLVPGLHGSGVAVSSLSETVYVADSATDLVDVYTAIPSGQPSFGGDAVTEVTSESATLDAELNPEGAPTSYRFEYGPCLTPATCASSGYPLTGPAGVLGADFNFHALSQRIGGLAPGRPYHFRVHASNVHSPTAGTLGPEGLLSTQVGFGGPSLPDNRMWELVSPPEKHGSRLQPLEPGGSEALGAAFNVSQAGTDGTAMTYLGTAPTESNPEGFSNEVQVLSTRGAAGGWSSHDLAVRHAKAAGVSTKGFEYRLFSSDLSSGLVQPFGSFIPSTSPQALAPGEATEQTPFIHANFRAGERGTPCTVGCYRPLVTGAPGLADVPPGTVFAPEPNEECRGIICGPVFVGATPDLSSVVLTSQVALTDEAPVEPGGEELYEWSAGKLTLVSILPEEAGKGVQAATLPTLGYGESGESKSVRGAIADNGRRVVWSTASGLYLRDTLRKQTIELDMASPGCTIECERGGGRFQIVSGDGTTVYFTDHHRLTSNSGAGELNADLYECRISDGPGGPACELSDITPRSGSGESANVLGEVLGTSEDGQTVYYVADGIEEDTTGAVLGGCGRESRNTAAASCNLYVHRDGKTSLVAVLSGQDERDWIPVYTTARVSQSGRWLAFMSQRPLTGYDTRPAPGRACHSDTFHRAASACPEVYLYDATRPVTAPGSSGPSNPLCASCDPTGAEPTGESSIPGRTPYRLESTLNQPRYLSDEGRLYFNSQNQMVPRDVNGTGDVYEYEPEGYVPAAGSQYACTASSATYTEHNGGCINLISSGVAGDESTFLDASENGSDVFFLTSAQLSSQDHDTLPDVYDAHECTASEPCPTNSSGQTGACTTEASCKVAPTPQAAFLGAPTSAVFSGSGNIVPVPALVARKLSPAQKLVLALKACRRRYHKRSKRTRCDVQARRRYRQEAKVAKVSPGRSGGR